jgi:hypothetical protein
MEPDALPAGALPSTPAVIAAADEKLSEHGPDAAVILIVGRFEHGYHHVLGSVPSAPERHVHYPVIIIP